jgi:hypothetical protein
MAWGGDEERRSEEEQEEELDETVSYVRKCGELAG